MAAGPARPFPVMTISLLERATATGPPWSNCFGTITSGYTPCAGV
jgi:hypothetical protein